MLSIMSNSTILNIDHVNNFNINTKFYSIEEIEQIQLQNTITMKENFKELNILKQNILNLNARLDRLERLLIKNN